MAKPRWVLLDYLTRFGQVNSLEPLQPRKSNTVSSYADTKKSNQPPSESIGWRGAFHCEFFIVTPNRRH